MAKKILQSQMNMLREKLKLVLLSGSLYQQNSDQKQVIAEFHNICALPFVGAIFTLFMGYFNSKATSQMYCTIQFNSL